MSGKVEKRNVQTFKILKLSKEFIDILHEYFSAKDDLVKQTIVSNLLLEQKQILQNIQECFINGVDAVLIVKQLQLEDFLNDIQQMQNSFNASTDAIFEQELNTAIKETERTLLKKKLIAIDAEENKFDQEITSAIIQAERQSIKSKIGATDTTAKFIQFNFTKYTKYAAAAIVTGVIVFSGYLILNNKDTIQPIAVNQKEIPKIAIPQKQQYKKTITVLEPESFGFTSSSKDTFTIITHIVLHTSQIDSIEKNIEELRKYYAEEITGKNNNGAGYGPRANLIKAQLDSLKIELQSILKYNTPNTYTLNISEKKLNIYLTKNVATSQPIKLDSDKKHKLFIKIENSFYLCVPTTIEPIALQTVNDKNIIEQLNKILFQNQ